MHNKEGISQELLRLGVSALLMLIAILLGIVIVLRVKLSDAREELDTKTSELSICKETAHLGETQNGIND